MFKVSPHGILLVGLALAEGGCASYTSDYVPPDDGRARVLFRDTKAIASLPPMDGACAREIDGNPDGPPFRVRRVGGGVTVVYWVPLRPLHPLVVLPGGGGAGTRELAAGPRQLASPTLHGPSGGGGHPSGGGSHSSSGGGSHSGSSGNSGGGDLGAAAVAIAVLAIAVLPIVTFSLVLSTPESEPNMSSSIDRVNLYNDLARSPGSPCAPPPEPEGPAPGAEPPASEQP